MSSVKQPYSSSRQAWASSTARVDETRPTEPQHKGYYAMGGAHLSIDSVIELGLKLSGVNESPYYGVRALKLNGRMLACTPVNKSAEVNSAVVAMGSEQRAALLKEHPLLYYITDHYAPYPTMLIRLSRISRADLERTLRMAWDFVSSDAAATRSAPRSRAKPKVSKPRSLRKTSGKSKS
jgi:hypothetical protein